MAKQRGPLMLVKIGDGEASEAFTTLCGLQSKSLVINNNSFDVSTVDCSAPDGQLWQELMTGMRSVSVNGNGMFEGGTSLDRFRAVTMGTGQADTTSAVCNFEVIVPDLGTFAAAFHINNLEFGGEQEGAVTASFELASSGIVTFTDAA